MKPVDYLRRVVALSRAGKIDDSLINELMNGLVMNGDLIYQDGMFRGSDGRLHTLSPDKITSVKRTDVVQRTEMPSSKKVESTDPARKR